MRLFKRVKSLNKIVNSLARAVPGMLNAAVVCLLVMLFFAVIATDQFRTLGEGCNDGLEGSPSWAITARGDCVGDEYFGNFFRSFYSLFQVLTGDSWSEAISRPMWYEQSPIVQLGVVSFFFLFIVVEAIVLLNVVLSVLLNEMVDPEDMEKQEQEVADCNYKQLKAVVMVGADVADVRRQMVDVRTQMRERLRVTREETAALRDEIKAALRPRVRNQRASGAAAVGPAI